MTQRTRSIVKCSQLTWWLRLALRVLLPGAWGQHQSDSTNSNSQENYNEKVPYFDSGRSVVRIDTG